MLDLRPYRHGDLDALSEPQMMQARRKTPTGNWKTNALDCVTGGPCWAVEHDGRPIAIGGLTFDQQDKGRAWVWCVIAKNAPKRAWPGMVKMALRILSQVVFMGVRVMLANTPTGWPEGRRLLILLGFEYRGTLPRFDVSGRDYSIWSRVT